MAHREPEGGAEDDAGLACSAVAVLRELFEEVVAAADAEAITSSLPREQQGVASALNDFTRELGAALGIALLGGLLVAGYLNAITGRLTGVPE